MTGVNRWRRPTVSLVVYVSITCWATWPAAWSPCSSIPLGTEPAATVPLFNAWTIWWNADRLTRGFEGYWDAPIFYPFAETFAWSEPQPMTLLAAPVLWMSGSRALAYNFYAWLALVLNGVFCERLLRRLGIRGVTAIGGGAAMVLLPIVHWQRDVLQLIPVWGVLWTWSGLLSVARRATWRGGVELGLGFGAVCLTSLHQGLFLAVLMLLAAPTMGLRWLRLRTLAAVLLAVAIAGAIVLPIAWPMHRMLAGPVFVRTPENVVQLSARLGDYCAAYGAQWMEWGTSLARPHWYLSPGWIKVALAVLGVAWGLSRRGWRWWTVFLCSVSGFALLLSLGPQLEIGDWGAWNWLQQHVPGFAQVRNVFRFAYFAQMGTVLLACQALQGLDVLRRRFTRRRGVRRCLACGLAVVGAAALLEVRPQPVQLADVPDAARHADWIELLQRDAAPDAGVACIPFAVGNSVADLELTARWMYLGTYHERLLVNGYSGFFPMEDFALRAAMPEGIPTPIVLRQFASDGVEWLVVLRAHAPGGLPTPPESVELQLVMSDDVGVDVYRLIPLPEEARD